MSTREHAVSNRNGSQVMVAGLRLRELGYCRGAHVHVTDLAGIPRVSRGPSSCQTTNTPRSCVDNLVRLLGFSREYVFRIDVRPADLSADTESSSPAGGRAGQQSRASGPEVLSSSVGTTATTTGSAGARNLCRRCRSARRRLGLGSYRPECGCADIGFNGLRAVLDSDHSGLAGWAATALRAFLEWEGAESRPPSGVTVRNPISTAGAAVLWSGLDADIGLLHQQTLVLRPTRPMGVDVVPLARNECADTRRRTRRCSRHRAAVISRRRAARVSANVGLTKRKLRSRPERLRIRR